MSQQIRLSSQAVFFNIVAIFAAVSSFHGVWAFSCYQCRGDGSCDVPTEAMKTDCTSPLGTIHTCIKAVVDAKTIRACGVPEVTIRKCSAASGVTVCMCAKEMCNSARHIQEMSFDARIFLLLSITISLVFWFASD